MRSKTYNGWTNYATWRVALELNNNKETAEKLEYLQTLYRNKRIDSRGAWEMLRDLYLFYFDDFPSRPSTNFYEILTT